MSNTASAIPSAEVVLVDATKVDKENHKAHIRRIVDGAFVLLKRDPPGAGVTLVFSPDTPFELMVLLDNKGGYLDLVDVRVREVRSAIDPHYHLDRTAPVAHFTTSSQAAAESLAEVLNNKTCANPKTRLVYRKEKPAEFFFTPGRANAVLDKSVPLKLRLLGKADKELYTFIKGHVDEAFAEADSLASSTIMSPKSIGLWLLPNNGCERIYITITRDEGWAKRGLPYEVAIQDRFARPWFDKTLGRRESIADVTQTLAAYLLPAYAFKLESLKADLSYSA